MRFYILIVLVLLLQCKKAEKRNIGSENSKDKVELGTSSEGLKVKVEGDSVEIPSYQLEVKLSEDAVKKLNANKETIVISTYFYGMPKDSTLLSADVKKNLDLYGLNLLKKDRELKMIEKNNLIKFDHLKIPKSLYNALIDNNISLNVNVYSGRRSFNDNILDIDAYDGNYGEVLKQSGILKLNGKLLSID